MTIDVNTNRESILRRIRALMAKTLDNGCTEAEAAEAARKVDELMASYEIDLDEVSMRQQEIIKVSIKIGHHSVKFVLGSVAGFTDCRAWMENSETVAFFGFKVDTEIAEYLTHLFKRAIDREGATWVLFNPEWDRAGVKGQPELLRSFGIGMAGRLGERLTDLKSSRDFTNRAGSGRDLVMMKRPAVDEALAKLGIVLGKAESNGPSPKHAAAFSAGRTAAQNVAINQGVANRAARQGGMLV